MDKRTSKLYNKSSKHFKLVDALRFFPTIDTRTLSSLIDGSVPTVYSCLRDLKEEHILVNVNNTGEKCIIIPEYAYFLGISIGASICKAAIINMNFDLVEKIHIKAQLINVCHSLKEVLTKYDSEDLLEKCTSSINDENDINNYIYFNTPAQLSVLKSAIDRLVRVFTATDSPLKIRGIGISTTGLVNYKSQEIVTASNLKYLEGQSKDSLLNTALKEYLIEKGITTCLIQNTNASVIAEKCFLLSDKNQDSQFRHAKNVASLYLGVGLGVGLCLNGKIYYGNSGYSGEIGHIPVPVIDNYFEISKEKLKKQKISIKDTCGRRNCYDHMIRKNVFYKSAQAFRNMSTDDICKLISSTWGNDDDKKFAAERRLLLGQYLGGMISTLINLLNLDVIVLSGKLYKMDRLLLESINMTLDDFCIATNRKQCSIIFSNKGTLSAAIGAAIYSYYDHFGQELSWDFDLNYEMNKS